MTDETKVDIETFWKKIDDTVYEYRRINGGEWEQIATPYREVPVIYWNSASKEESL